jgi:hypothetical protein
MTAIPLIPKVLHPVVLGYNDAFVPLLENYGPLTCSLWIVNFMQMMRRGTHVIRRQKTESFNILYDWQEFSTY